MPPPRNYCGKRDLSLTKVGFTLAEVLITLCIIGVVAALTLPALINNTKHKEWETGLKKSYSVLQQALIRMQDEEGLIINLENYPGNTFAPIFKKYFAGAMDCGQRNCETIDGELSDIDNQASKNYKIFSKKRVAGNGFFDNGQYILSDSMFIMIENDMNPFGIWITVDVNGLRKKPNVWGYDTFTFQIMPDTGKLIPMGAPGTLYANQDSSYCSYESSDRMNGVTCTHKAFDDKDYFKNLK